MNNKGKSIVVNTSPWISLSVCGQICLLERLYHDVYIPTGLNVIGTLGLLLKAKKQGLLSSVKPSIDKILESVIWIKEDIAKGILKDAGEE